LQIYSAPSCLAGRYHVKDNVYDGHFSAQT
jgi:hypothetical protein